MKEKTPHLLYLTVIALVVALVWMTQSRTPAPCKDTVTPATYTTTSAHHVLHAKRPTATEDGFWGWAWNGILHVVDATSQAFGDAVNGMFGVGTTPGSGGYGGGGGSGFPD